MARRDEPLVELLELGPLHDVPQFLLPHEEDLEDRPRVLLQVGEEAQLLQRGGVQPLSLVDDQQGAAAGACLLNQEALEMQEHGGLVEARHVEPEGVSHLAQELVGPQLGGDEAGRDRPVARDPGEQALYERGLAGSRPARDHDEALGAPQGVLHVLPGAGEARVLEAEPRVGAEPEGVCGKAVVRLVHGGGLWLITASIGPGGAF